MRQIVITEKMLDQLVGEAQDRITAHIRDTYWGDKYTPNAIRRANEIVERLGEDIKEAT